MRRSSLSLKNCFRLSKQTRPPQTSQKRQQHVIYQKAETYETALQKEPYYIRKIKRICSKLARTRKTCGQLWIEMSHIDIQDSIRLFEASLPKRHLAVRYIA